MQGEQSYFLAKGLFLKTLENLVNRVRASANTQAHFLVAIHTQVHSSRCCAACVHNLMPILSHPDTHIHTHIHTLTHKQCMLDPAILQQLGMYDLIPPPKKRQIHACTLHTHKHTRPRALNYPPPPPPHTHTHMRTHIIRCGYTKRG